VAARPLGRSVTDLLATVQELEHLGVGLVLTEALDLTIPAATAADPHCGNPETTARRRQQIRDRPTAAGRPDPGAATPYSAQKYGCPRSYARLLQAHRKFRMWVRASA